MSEPLFKEESLYSRDKTIEELKASLQRFVDGHFRNPGKEYARTSIPADRTRDDDLVLGSAIEELSERREEMRKMTPVAMYAQNLSIAHSRGRLAANEGLWAELEKAVEEWEGAGPYGAPLTKCTCAAIQATDPTRHFRECPLREDHPTVAPAVMLQQTFAEYQRWQDGNGDARTFVDWVRDELTCPHDKRLSMCDECPR